MAKNLEWYLRNIRRRLDDFGGDVQADTWLSDDSACEWKNDELVDYINEAVEEVAQRYPIRDNVSSLCVLDLLAGVGVYEYDPLIMTIERATLSSNSKKLEKLTETDMDYFKEDDVEEVLYYLENETSNLIRLITTPTVDDTLLLEVTRLPLEELAFSDLTAFPEVPENFSKDLIHWVLHLAYSKEGPTTQDLTRAAYFENRFVDKMGERPDAKQRGVRRALANKKLRSTTYFS